MLQSESYSHGFDMQQRAEQSNHFDSESSVVGLHVHVDEVDHCAEYR